MISMLRPALVLALSGALLASGAAAAYADSQEELVNRYSTLSGALISAQAQSQDLSISNYLKATQATLYTLPAQNQPTSMAVLASRDLTLMAGTPLHATSITELNSQLAQSGVAFTSSDYSSLSSLAGAVTGKFGSADAQVTLAGAQWAASMGTLTAPELSVPTAPEVGTPAVPENALPFGLLVNKTVTRIAVDAPQLLNQIMATGISTPKQQAAWNKAMAAAWEGSETDLASTVPDSCTGGMLAIMASGDPSSGDSYEDCDTACRAGGLYLHNQSLSIFNPQRLSPVPEALNTAMTAADVDALPPAVREALASQSVPPMMANPAALISGVGTSCGTARQNTTATLSTTLPGIWGNLNIP